jgi:hypothetical protein
MFIVFLLSFFTLFTEPELQTVNLSFDTTINSNQYEAISIGYSIKSEKELITQSILSTLKSGDQIKFSRVSPLKHCSSSNIKKLEPYNLLFYILFSEDHGIFEWKLYEVNSGTFIIGKQYDATNVNDKLLRTISADIWLELFSEQSPFNYLLAYIKKDIIAKKDTFHVVITSPFTKKFTKNIVSSNSPIVDLAVLETTPIQSIALSQATTKNIRILKLTSDGSLVRLIDLPGTSTSICSYEKGVLYIRSGKLCQCYYDEKEKAFVHAPCKKNDLGIYASVAITQDQSMICVKDFSVYVIDYEINKNGSITCKHERKISSSKAMVASATYSPNSNTIITSEKIKDHYQLVSYNLLKPQRTIITKSTIHKQDPCISPCGNYVAYVSFNDMGDGKTIEIMNMYTKKIISITETEGHYVCPIWITRPT